MAVWTRNEAVRDTLPWSLVSRSADIEPITLCGSCRVLTESKETVPNVAPRLRYPTFESLTSSFNHFPKGALVRSHYRPTGLILTVLLSVGAIGGTAAYAATKTTTKKRSTTTSTKTTAKSTQTTTKPAVTTTKPSATTTAVAAVGGRGPGGPGAGGGPGGQAITAVNLNTNGSSPGGANTAEVAAAAKAFLATLDSTKQAAVSFEYTKNKERQTWSNFPTTFVPRVGIALADLTLTQRTAVFQILKVALSDTGYQQVLDIQKSDDWLSVNSAGGGSDFGSLKYYIAIFGTPSDTTPFMVQFGGHHLVRMLTYNGDKVSETPQFVGTEPTSFQLDGKTYEPLKAESTTMFGMLSGLSDAHLASAKITSGTFNDLVMGPGKDSGVFPSGEGVLVSDLNDTERKAVTAAITTYVADLAEPAASKLLAKYQAEYNQTRIGWSNNKTATEENSYIRIDGPSVWIEFINTHSGSTPNIHFHSVYRDKTNDYGSSKPS
jgi:Protein of unknown function (DUF3500)